MLVISLMAVCTVLSAWYHPTVCVLVSVWRAVSVNRDNVISGQISVSSRFPYRTAMWESIYPNPLSLLMLAR